MVSNTLIQIKPFSCKPMVLRGQPPSCCGDRAGDFLRTYLPLECFRRPWNHSLSRPDAGRGQGQSLALMPAMGSSSMGGDVLPSFLTGSVHLRQGLFMSCLSYGIWLPPREKERSWGHSSTEMPCPACMRSWAPPQCCKEMKEKNKCRPSMAPQTLVSAISYYPLYFIL